MRKTQAFETPTTAARTLGLREDAVWLRIPFSTSHNSSGLWVLDIDYPVINRVDVFLVTAGRVVTQGRMGNLGRPADRLVSARSLAMGLTLSPATDYPRCSCGSKTPAP